MPTLQFLIVILGVYSGFRVHSAKPGQPRIVGIRGGNGLRAL